MAQALRFEEHIKGAELIAQEITGMEVPMSDVGLTTVTMDHAVEEMVLEDFLADELEDNGDPLPNVVSSDMQDGNVAQFFSVSDVGDINRNVASAMDGHMSALQLKGTLNTNDSDSDVEIVADISISEQARAKANKICVEWVEPVVCFFALFAVFC